MMPSVSLKVRCYLLVAFPLICQLSFAAYIWHEWSELHTELLKESDERKLLTDMGMSGRIIFEDVSMVSDNFAQKDVEQRLQKMNEDLKIFDKDQAEKAQARRVSESANTMYQLYLRRQVRGHHTSYEQLFDSMIAFGDEVASLLRLEESNRALSSSRSHEKRDQINKVLLSGLAATCGFALVFAYWYAWTISRPVSRLAENSRLLSQRKPLLPPLEGKDELAQVDYTFHVAAATIYSALDKEKAMIENAADVICTINKNGTFVSANAYAQNMLHVSPAELAGKSLYNLAAGADSLSAEEHVRNACNSRATTVFEMKLKTGESNTVDTRWSAFWSNLEKQLFCVVHDVTEEKRIAQMKEDFVAMISHDLRSPLTSILGSTSLIKAGAAGPVSEEVGREINSADKNVKQLVSFVNDILDFQKLGAGKMALERATCDLNELISNAVELVSALADSKGVKIELPEGTKKLRCDGQKIVQTLVNLLSNAIKFSPSGSTVKLSLNELGNFIQINVVDRGPGVPDEFKEAVFTPFEQGPKRAKEGTGLGLAIAKMIVEAHGGSVGVSDAKNAEGATEGSEFWLRLPADVI